MVLVVCVLFLCKLRHIFAATILWSEDTPSKEEYASQFRALLNERKWFYAKKKGKKQTISRTITDVDYADNIALLANTPIQARSLLHSLEQAAGGIGPHVNADKMEYICFNEKGDISTVNVSALKLVNKFTYHGSNIPQNSRFTATYLSSLKPSK